MHVDLHEARSAGLSPSRRMRAKFIREVAEARLPAAHAPRAPITEGDLSAFPSTVRRYLRFMNVVGQPPTWSFRVRSEGVFRLAPGRSWMRCEAWQYDTNVDVARIFHMRLRMGGLVPLLVRDTYVRGRGRMRARVLDAFDLVDEASDELDAGELVTYLNDALLFAPSMLLGPNIVWTDVSDDVFSVALTDRGRTVRGSVFVDARGAIVDFSTMDRHVADPRDPKMMTQARWSTPIGRWRTVRGRPRPTSGSAVWYLPSGAFTYARFAFADDAVELDVPSRS